MLQPKKTNISNKSKKKPFQLQDERNLVQKDNTPNIKRDLSLMLAEYNNAKKDEQELRTTGQIKNPNSIQYRRNVKIQPEVKQDNISTEQRNAQLSPLERPLIYLANPSKILGDLGVPNMETSELDRQAIVANRFNPNQTRFQRLKNQVKLGLGYVPEATVNTAMAAAFMPEGSGALGLVNEALNPLAGIKTGASNYFTNPTEKVTTSLKNNLKSLFSGRDIMKPSNLIPKEELDDIINRELNYVKSKEYISNRVKNTGEKIEDIEKEISQYEKYLDEAQINIDEGVSGGSYYRPSNTVRAGAKGKPVNYTKGVVQHEVGHLLSPIGLNEKAYKNFPIIDFEPKFSVGNKKYNMLPEEQQVRNNKIKTYMEDIYSKKRGSEFNDEDIKNLLGENDFNSIDYNPYYEDASNFIKDIKHSNPTNYKDLLKEALNKSWATLPIAGASYLATQGQEESKKLQQGGYINQNTNMNRYAQGGDLTQFNTGGTHEQSPIGGVPIGANASVEQGETKQNNFVYSNRIFLDSNVVSQYNLPKSLIGKSVADATKFIDNKFKGRNDKISQSTKNGMLSKIAEAQEAMKPQEPEMEQPQENIEQSQMALGGFAGSTIGQGFGAEATGAQQSQAIGAGLGTLTTALDLGKTAFGKPAQDTSGLAPSAPVNSGGMIAGSAMKGAQAGMAFGPWGAGIGAVVGAGAGLLGSKKAEKAAMENTNNYAVNVNKQFSDKYAYGGEIDPPTKITVDNLINTPIVTGVKPISQSDRFRYAVGEQSGVQHGTSGEQGHYLYYGKKPGDSGFNPTIHREFVNQGGYDTYMKSPQGQQYRRNLSTQSLQPIEQLGYGGKVKKMGDGGFADNPFDEYSKRTLPQLNLQPINQVIPSFINKGTSINNAQAIIGTKVDGDFGKNSKLALDKYRQSKGMSNVGQPLSNVDYTAMGLTSDGYKINKNAFRQQLPENLNLKLDSPIEGFNKYTGIENNVEAGKDKKSLAGKGLSYVNDNLGNIARYAPIAANALQLAQLKKPQGERLDRLGNRYKPEYVDETALQNIADQTMNNSVNAIGQSGASQGQLRSSIIGSQLQRTKAISDAYSQAAAQNRQQNAMAQEFNLGVDRVNLQQSTLEKDNNARDQAAYRNAKREYITGIGEGIGNVGNEQAYKKIAKNTTGYTWDGTYVKTPDGNIVTNPATGKPMTQEELKQSQASKDKKALGGYLIKNRVK